MKIVEQTWTFPSLCNEKYNPHKHKTLTATEDISNISGVEVADPQATARSRWTITSGYLNYKN